MEENKNYVEVKSQERSFKSPKKYSFGKNVLVPFASGVLGAGVLLGVAFNVPYVKQNLLGISNPTQNSQGSSSVNYNNLNTDLISLSNFSDTGVYVAQTVRPSIVGISVEYSVSTIFSRVTSTAKAEGSGVIISQDGYILTNNHVISTSSNSSTHIILMEKLLK